MANRKPDLTIPDHGKAPIMWHGMHGITEASDLGKGPVASRVWSDACDVGFYITSPRTGARVLFTLTSEDRKRGEVESWTYTSEDGKHILIVLND